MQMWIPFLLGIICGMTISMIVSVLVLEKWRREDEEEGTDYDLLDHHSDCGGGCKHCNN